jgi:hypothetical protein
MRTTRNTSKLYIGIDNGVSGSLAAIASGFAAFQPTPIFSEQSYTKTKKRISRVNVTLLAEVLVDWKTQTEAGSILALIERPMVNPGRFNATLSAMRALEATLVVLEFASIPIIYVDSREWQKVMLPAGYEKEELKQASMDIGCRLYPVLRDVITKHKDADSLLMAEWARRKGL